MCLITVLLHDLLWSLLQGNSGHLKMEAKYLLLIGILGPVAAVSVMGAVREGGPPSVQIEAQKICICKASVNRSSDSLLSTREGNFLPTFSFGLQAFRDT